jgi:ectoine hydroxylase-related dioxygenase (phytanoyl-CoA dioxygenase family)
MKDDSARAQRARQVWLTPDACDLGEFKALIARKTMAADCPSAAEIVANVPIYEGAAIRAAAADPTERREMMAEWASLMLNGPGIVVLRGAFPDPAPVDAVTKIFFEIIEEQHRDNKASGDHFAKPGANDRVWNALEKLCLRDPAAFAAYYSNDALAMVSQAWLGTGCQFTSQVNCVNPGGAAQSAHRDYHMGFQTAEEIEGFPVHAHALSPMLTLQGAVAHCDMPVETGPTLYLPFSQTYVPGYLAWRKPEFAAYFDSNHVQLPLKKGDAAFFNPALFHAAGHNRTADVKRLGNLLQISSAYGRAMESVDRVGMVKALYPTLAASKLAPSARANAIAASAEGYAFPTNLDRDPPIGGLAPESQAQLMKKALAEGWTAEAFAKAVDEHATRRLT